MGSVWHSIWGRHEWRLAGCWQTLKIIDMRSCLALPNELTPVYSAEIDLHQRNGFASWICETESDHFWHKSKINDNLLETGICTNLKLPNGSTETEKNKLKKWNGAFCSQKFVFSWPLTQSGTIPFFFNFLPGANPKVICKSQNSKNHHPKINADWMPQHFDLAPVNRKSKAQTHLGKTNRRNILF